MASTERIELLKQRNFAETLGETFTFIRLNLGIILKVHFLISLPVILVTAAVFVLLFRDYFSLLTTIQNGPFIDSIATDRKMNQTLVSAMFSFLAITPVSICTFAIIDCYSYNESEKVTFEEVWSVVKRKYPSVFFAKLLIVPTIFLPGLLLFLPGMAFFTLFLCTELLIMQHSFPIFRALGRSVTIMSKNFWLPLWTNCVIVLLYVLFNALMLIPVELLEFALGMGSGIMDLDSPGALLAMSLRTFNTIATYILYTIPTVAIGLQYFSIREKMSGANIMERIRKIGIESTDKRSIRRDEEEY